LCGEHDRNLAALEDRLQVQIVRRGNRLTIVGEGEARERAAEVLRALYQRLESGRGLEAGDIDRELRMGPAARAAGPQEGDQIDMPGLGGDRVEVRTRRKVVEPRTAAQKAYVRALFEHELAFGIGPAGTARPTSPWPWACRCSWAAMWTDHPVAPRRRGGRAPGLPARRREGEGRPLHAAALRRAERLLPAKQVQKMIEEKVIEIAPLAFMRGRRCPRLRGAGRGAERHLHADEDVPHAPGRGVAHGGDRRPHPDRPAARRAVGLIEAERLLSGVPRISFTRFTARDVVRHPLVAAIIEAYDKDALARTGAPDGEADDGSGGPPRSRGA
jgi:phosphate starvation-inducible PhoH-like protein